MSATALFIGLALAAGIWLVAVSRYRLTHIDFSDRISSQLRAVEIQTSLSIESQRRPLGIWGGIAELFKPVLMGAAQRLNASSVSREALTKRLVQEGAGRSATDFRMEQVIWATAALALAGLVLSVGAFQSKVPLLALFILTVASGAAGFLARDWWLGEAIKKREQSMLEEFPPLAELMALSVTAGESAVSALERVCSCSQGELSREFSLILSQTRSGDGLVVSLQDFSARTSVPELSRFVDGIVVAIERGTPLAEVLRAQAQDVRDSAKRQLMETAGKKEIAMMAPVIFFVLPLTVVFAVFPGLSLLDISF